MNDLFDDPAYRVPMMTLQLLGLWPYQTYSTRVIIQTIIICDLTFVIIPMLWYVTIDLEDMADLINCLPIIFMAYVAVTSLVNYKVKFNKLINILDFMKMTRRNLRDTSEIQIFQRYAKAGQILTTTMFGILIYNSVPLISKGIDLLFLPNKTEPMLQIYKVHFYNLDSEKHYIEIYVFSFISTFIIVFQPLVSNILFLAVTQCACSMFSILGNKMETINRLNDEQRSAISNRQLDQVLSNEIKNCIYYHWDCIAFSQLIEDLFKYLWILQFFGNAIFITIVAAQTVIYVSKPIQMISAALNTSAMTVHIFLITWAAQQLLDHSNRLSEFVYNIDWYEFPPLSKKLLLIMLMRSSRPCKITAGGMIELNLEFFCSLMKLSTTYFTLVLSTQ